MKKALLAVLFFGLAYANAQQPASKKFFQRVSAGAVVSVLGATTFSGSEKPFSMGYNVMPNLLVITPKTFHNFSYGMAGNSFNSLNGYFLHNNFDTYLLYSKSLNTNGMYLGYGIEKMFVAEDIRCFLFSEIGTDFKGTKIFSIGLLTSAQIRLWQRK